MFDKDVGVNWHLRFRLKIEQLQQENEELKLKNRLSRSTFTASPKSTDARI